MFDAEPDGWARLRLRDLFQERKERGRHGLPIASVTLDSGLVLRSTLDRRVDSALNHEEHALVRKDDVVYNMMRMWQGACGLAKSDCLVSPAYVVMTPSSAILPDFAVEMLRSPAVVKLLHAYSHGVVDDRLRLYPDAFGQIPVRLPPLSEQRHIAEVLRSVDDAIAYGDAALVAAVSVRRCTLDALMRELADDPNAEAAALCEVAEVRTGLAKNKNADGRHVRLPYLRVANVQNGWFDLSDMQEIDVEPNKVERYSLKVGDVLLTEGGDYDKLGRGAVWKAQVQPCLHQNHIFCVRADQTRLLPEFLALVTQSFLGRSYFLSCAKRTTNLASINSSQLKALPIPIPSLEQQAAVVAEVGCIDALIECDGEKQASFRRLRASLQADLFSGRVRVPA